MDDQIKLVERACSEQWMDECELAVLVEGTKKEEIKRALKLAFEFKGELNEKLVVCNTILQILKIKLMKTFEYYQLSVSDSALRIRVDPISLKNRVEEAKILIQKINDFKLKIYSQLDFAEDRIAEFMFKL